MKRYKPLREQEPKSDPIENLQKSIDDLRQKQKEKQDKLKNAKPDDTKGIQVDLQTIADQIKDKQAKLQVLKGKKNG